jgi:NAD(P)-dependent dehydrogenase (short-subunit alcohol dehydrogenase family)
MAAAHAIAGKNVVVTGGSRGIGLGLVKELLARSGNTVVATARVAASAGELAALRAAHGERLRVAELEVSSPASVAAWADGLRNAGVGHVDVLINNAGVYGRRLGLDDLSAEDFATAFAANATGPFLVVHHLRRVGLLAGGKPSLLAGGKPSLLGGGGKPSLVANMSSIMASHGDPTISSVTPGGYAYRASKAALNAIHKALAMEGGGLSAVLLHPGYVRTDMTGGQGYVDVAESAAGLLRVLESAPPEALNGRWFGHDGAEIPW